MSITGNQLEILQSALHRGADKASDALGRWIERPARIAFDSIEQLAIEEATSILGTSDEPICCCTVEFAGRFAGHFILAFDDESGLALADMLLGQPRGQATDWSNLETSAALETTNIVCCAYLNALVRELPTSRGEPEEILPSPPRFTRDFAESVLQFALMDQIVMSDQVLFARTKFHIDGSPVDWTLLFVPAVESMTKLRVDSS